MRRNILATLAYYDVLDIALNAEEIFRFMIKLNGSSKSSIAATKSELSNLLQEKIVDSEDGLYFLSGRNILAPLRSRHEEITIGKWRKARRAIAFLKPLPFVRGVFASGSLAFNNSEELSDLDVLVVLKHGRIWLGRILVSGLMSLLGVRRKYFEKIAPNKICLNHYITDKSLAIPFKSMYNAQTYLNLVPILLKDEKILDQFCQANLWVGDFVFLDSPVWIKKHNRKTLKFGLSAKLFSGMIEWILNKTIADWLEKISRNYQIKKIKRNPITKEPNGHIVYGDDQLAFHPDSPEQKILTKYRKNLERVLASVQVQIHSIHLGL